MGKNNPKIGEKIKQNGVTWTYKRVNTGGARGLMWTTKARIGTDGGRNIFDIISAATIEDGVLKLLTARRADAAGQQPCAVRAPPRERVRGGCPDCS